MKRRNTMTAAVFLLAVAAGFLLLATSFFGGEGKFEALLKAFVQNRDVMAFVDGAESAVNGDLDRDHLFIQLYGGVQRLSGRRVVEDAVGENTVVRLSTGGLNFVDLQAAPGVGPQVAENAAATAAFSQALEALGIPYLYVNAPQKLQRGEALLPTGVEEYGNESADAFLAELERRGTDYVDLRPLFEENGIYSNWFFRTDHHWKPEAAFFAWQALTDELEERYGLSANPALTDPANWDTRVLEHFFLGSQGKRVGSLYAGADDITLYTPKFDSELTYSCPAYGFTRTGPFETSVCFPERVARAGLVQRQPLYLLRRRRLPHRHHHQPQKSGRAAGGAAAGLLCLRPHPLPGPVLLGADHHRSAVFRGGFAGHHCGPGAGYSPHPLHCEHHPAGQPVPI